MENMTLREVDALTRLKLHALPLIAVGFLGFYGQIVCPFINSIALTQVMGGLGIVCVIQIIVREGLFQTFPKPREGTSISRHGFYLSVVSWFFSGLVAVVIHANLYPEFPLESHGKLLVGYWALGGGILSQFEFIKLEHYFRAPEGEAPITILERITQRLMEGYAIFTIVPTMVMVLMAFRFVYEGYTVLGVALEVMFLGVCFVAAALFIAWHYGLALRRDCDHILKALEMVTEGYYDIRIDASRSDELGRVASGINDMAKGLMLREHIRDAFGRFVNPEVAEQFLDEHAQNGHPVKLGGQRKQVTILLSDLRDFTQLSENLEPEVLTKLLNDYFSEMVDAIRTHGGMVDKFMGDAVMAVFGLADEVESSAADAIETAVEMRRRLRLFNDRQRAEGGPVLENGIGIHLGEVVAGYIGSVDRLEYTVIGPSVNLAARIENEARAPNPAILFSSEVAAVARDSQKTLKVGRFKLKGISEDIDLYTVERREQRST
ncbi:MAG: adenylate/guanylate cyclase domain-containing protein [Rhodospirillaceae bacterium]|jgi:adenylate cyclase|nr:adenylate/guanylate cyclase domain-containing protein [Rhodospirillales bacterium]MBT3905954.1 adenylate/guanylate cyclase domain-containing protein [Rhodospirillaceae bacterium]MBT4700839.1 adenylate/guanylate cyclase domain-containing protein [Rhodospirillaceae bacterium]MBT5034555.1 adenylate/guanylate cyclase domain-containing protein [Rhodospirillaceae bacterium]MBT6221214.1 adenylate/guanylate cyclase domain-containing protein [Rhodospirillaceae bacterium]